MTPTNATPFAPTFSYRAAVPAISENPMLIAVEWQRRPPKHRRTPFSFFSALCCDFVEATISASFSWISSLIIVGLMQCATTLTTHHGVSVLACLKQLFHVTNVFQ